MGPHLCGHPVVQQPPCFPASTGPLRRRRLAAAYRPLLINYDYTWGGTHICIHPTAPTEIHKYVVKLHMLNISISSPLWRDEEEVREGKSQGLRQIGCLVAHGDNIWERNMLGWWDFFLEPILSKNHCIHRFWGSLNVLNIHWVIKTDAACDCIVLMSLEKKVETDSTSHTFKHLDIVAVQYQVRFGLLLYLSSNSLRLPCCHGNHALRCHFP